MLRSSNRTVREVRQPLQLRLRVCPLMKYSKQQAGEALQFLGNSTINHWKLRTRLQTVYSAELRPLNMYYQVIWYYY